MIPDFPYNIRIRLAQLNFFCCPLTLLSLSLAFQNWDSQQVRDLATSGRNRHKFQLGQSYFYIMRKVWYHQIWIQNNLGFMVLILVGAHCLDLDLNGLLTRLNFWRIPDMLRNHKIPKFKEFFEIARADFEIILLIHFYPRK